MVTKIILEKATSKQGKPYALFNFQTVSKLSPEEADHARVFSQQFMEIVNAAQLVPELAEALLNPFGPNGKLILADKGYDSDKFVH